MTEQKHTLADLCIHHFLTAAPKPAKSGPVGTLERQFRAAQAKVAAPIRLARRFVLDNDMRAAGINLMANQERIGRFIGIAQAPFDVFWMEFIAVPEFDSGNEFRINRVGMLFDARGGNGRQYSISFFYDFTNDSNLQASAFRVHVDIDAPDARYAACTEEEWAKLFSQLVAMTAPDDQARFEEAKEKEAPRGLLWASLAVGLVAIINSVTLRTELVERQGPRMASRRHAPFLQHHTLSIEYPKRAGKRYVQRCITQASNAYKKRAHEVIGHWRVLGRGTANERKTWIKAHQRGDASLGFVTHDYEASARRRDDHRALLKTAKIPTVEGEPHDLLD